MVVKASAAPGPVCGVRGLRAWKGIRGAMKTRGRGPGLPKSPNCTRTGRNHERRQSRRAPLLHEGFPGPKRPAGAGKKQRRRPAIRSMSHIHSKGRECRVRRRLLQQVCLLHVLVMFGISPRSPRYRAPRLRRFSDQPKPGMSRPISRKGGFDRAAIRFLVLGSSACQPPRTALPESWQVRLSISGGHQYSAAPIGHWPLAAGVARKHCD